MPVTPFLEVNPENNTLFDSRPGKEGKEVVRKILGKRSAAPCLWLARFTRSMAYGSFATLTLWQDFFSIGHQASETSKP
jgi:hypothetical protein